MSGRSLGNIIMSLLAACFPVLLGVLGITFGYEAIPIQTITASTSDDVFSADTLVNPNCDVVTSSLLEANQIQGWCPDNEDNRPGVTVTFKTPSILQELEFGRISTDCGRTITPIALNSYLEFCSVSYFDLDDNEWKFYRHHVPVLASSMSARIQIDGDIFTDRISIIPENSQRKPCFALKISGIPVTEHNIEKDDLSFQSISNGVLATPWGDFQVTGDVRLVPETTKQQAGRAVKRGGHGEHHLLFHGHGGSCHHDEQHGSHGYGHLPPVRGPLGFCSSVSASFGPGHDHGHPFFLFNSNNASLVYNNQNLYASVHCDGKHWTTQCGFNPVHNHDHHLSVSFHHLHGLGIHVDNSHHCLNNRPSQQNYNASSVPQMCMGHCNVLPAPTDCALQGLAFFGASLGHLISAGLQGHFGFPSTTLAPLTSPTVPATRAPKTATTSQSIITSTGPSSSGPICYNCAQQTMDNTCTAVTRCNTGEVCAVYNDTSGYTHKCLLKKICELSKALTATSCFECCSTYFCNKKCPTVCKDTQDCSLLSSTGYNVCGDTKVAHSICNNTCQTC